MHSSHSAEQAGFASTADRPLPLDADVRARVIQLESVADGTSVMLTLCSHDLRYLFVNRACAQLLGLPREQIIGQPIAAVMGEAAFEKIRPHIEQVLQGQVVEYETELPYAHAGPRIVHVKYVPDRGPGGEVRGWIGSIRDITDQKRAEEALRHSEERFRELANNIDQFAWTCDELGYSTWYNRRWYDYTGTTFEEMKGDGWKKIQDPEHLDRVVARVEQCVAAGKAWEDTFPLRAKDGTYRWFLSRAVPIRDENGRVLRWFGTNTDVTELRQLEEALREVDRRKDEFLATLAHELRNPLAPIRHALQILSMKGNVTPEMQWATDLIDRQVQQMTRLIDDLLDVSRISRDKLELREEQVELAKVVESAIETSRPLIEQLNHKLNVTLPPDSVVIEADRTRLAQVFSNLLNNAAKYTKKGGRIDLKAERQEGNLIVSVKDSGIGIPADRLLGIFEMFSQVQSALVRSHGGLGIGLWLVKRLVEMHGGTVEARSDGREKGSEFVVRLPIVVESPRVPSVAESTNRKPPTCQLRILVVDDNRDSADALGIMLRIMGNEIRTAYDGEEALQMAEEFRPEVVLLDIGLPKMNGYEVCRLIREQLWGKSIAMIAVTGWGQAADRQKSAEAGFDQHMVKPVDPTALMRLLTSLAVEPGNYPINIPPPSR